MRSLFRFFSWRHQRRHLLRAGLGLSSIALGVALFVSVQVAQESTVHAFRQSMKRISGKAELRVSRGRGVGIELDALRKIEAIDGVIAAPVFQQSTTFPDLESGPVLVLGVDFKRESKLREFTYDVDVNPFLMNDQAVLITRSYADRHQLKMARRLRVNTPAGLKQVHVAGFIDDTGPAQVFDGHLAVMGIGGAQKLFSRDRVDRIDVFPASAADAVRESLGAGYLVEPVQTTNSIMEEVLSRVRSLVVVSMIAMLVGLFIIYLSVSIGVVERTKETGTLRALGGSRRQILTLFLTEAGVLGLVGSCIGIGLGYGLARILIEYTATNINLMSFLVHVDEVVFPAWTVIAALGAGTFVSLLAALSPSLRATAISPIEVLRPATYGRRLGSTYKLGFFVGALLAVGASIGILGFYFTVPAWGGLVMTGLVFLGTALMLPQITIWLSRVLRRPLRAVFRIEGYLAADNVMKYPQRTALTVIALGGALSLMVATASIFTSFDRSTSKWMDEAFPWDLSVQATDLGQAYFSEARLPAETFDRVKDLDGVASAFPIQAVLQPYGASDIMLVAIDMKAYWKMMEDAGLTREDLPRSDIDKLAGGNAVGVSSNFMRMHGVGPGDEVELRTPDGPMTFRVVNQLEDYTWPQGVIAIDLDLYRKHWKDTSISYIDIRVEPGTDVSKVQAALGKALENDFQAFVYTREKVKAVAGAAIDESFRMTHVQVLIAMVIGFLGIVNTLLISVLQRTREIGLLRAVGMTRGQVARTVVIESVLVAFIGGMIGVAGGLIGAAFPISMHVMRVTGYELLFFVPWLSLVIAVAASLALGFAASFLPARRAAGLNLMEAIGYE